MARPYRLPPIYATAEGAADLARAVNRSKSETARLILRDGVRSVLRTIEGDQLEAGK
jgi:hypothetical protein